jgi:sugar phosphate isomerase/epimerase
MPIPSSTRRRFLRHAAVLGTGAATASLTSAAPATPSAAPDFCLFTKHLIGMEPAALAGHVAALGFSGLEAPIRPGGHIEPAAVPDKLPAFVETLRQSNLKLTILTSGINAIDPAQHTESVLTTAAKLGIKYYRLNWFKYDLAKPLLPQLADISAKIKDLLALSRQLGIRPLSQNHNGPGYVGAAIWDLESIMRDHAPEDWGFAYDIMHATIVGGTSWEIQYRLARPRIVAAFFKDFTWESKLKPGTCPLGEGLAPAAQYAKFLRTSGFQGPVSLHIEYLKAQRITTPDEARSALEAATRDFAKLRQWWSE